MSAVIATAIGVAATAGAGIYAANKNSGAAEHAADTQSAAAVKSAQITTDAANHAADLQSQSAKDALAFSRSQSQLALDQYNQQQTRLQPYRNLGNFALGMAPGAAPAPLQLAALPGQSTLPSTQTATSGNIAPGASSSLSAASVPGGDYKSWFQNLTGGKPLDQKGLEALAPQLQAAGVQLGNPNASGVISKIGLPDGSWVRVLDGDTSQANPTVWMQQPGYGPSATAPTAAAPKTATGFQSSQLAPRQITTDAPMMPFRALGSY